MKTYPPGYFIEPMLKWVPTWESRMPRDKADPLASAKAAASREQAQAEGKGWGSGTVMMPNTPKWAAPGRMR